MSDDFPAQPDVEGMIALCTLELRKENQVPEGKPCDEIDRVVAAGINFIATGTIVDDPVFHPVTGFAYTSARVRGLVHGLVQTIVYYLFGGLPPSAWTERLAKFHALSEMEPVLSA